MDFMREDKTTIHYNQYDVVYSQVLLELNYIHIHNIIYSNECTHKKLINLSIKSIQLINLSIFTIDVLVFHFIDFQK